MVKFSMMKKYLSLIIIFAIVIFGFSCESNFVESKVKMVLTGSVHGQLDPCG